MNRLVTAVRFLTIVPLPGRHVQGAEALGRAAIWFPLVGVALGAVLVGADRVLSRLFPPLLSALLVLTLWKFLTGGVHLDGLADCLDGLGARDPARRLAIMRDGRIGTFGAVGLILLLLLALAALAELAQPIRSAALLLAPLVGRYAPLLLARTFHPLSHEPSTGGAFMRAVSGAAALAGAAMVAVSAWLILGIWGELVAAVGLGAALASGWIFSRRLRGLTGDGLGAGVELAELTILLSVVALANLSLL